MYLIKSYDALDWYQYMEILLGYGIGLQTERLLHLYWGHLLMVTQVEQYYGAPLQLLCGVTQVYPLSVTIFNMLVDTFIRYWMALVKGGRPMHMVLDSPTSCLQRSFMRTAGYCLNCNQSASRRPWTY